MTATSPSPSTSASPPRLDVREYADSDEAAVLGLLDASLAGGPTGKRSADFFRWKHHANPFGRSPALVAVDPDTGAVVGLRTWLRWRFGWHDIDVSAVRAVDTATHPDFQGRGIFRLLTTSSLEVLAADTDLVFNTPNEKSRPGYLKMGWSDVAKTPLALAPRRPDRMLAHRGDLGSGGARVEVPPCPLQAAADVLEDSRLDALAAHAAAATDRMHTKRSGAFLRWRYSAPGLAYHVAVVESGGDLAALAFCRSRYRGALRELILTDVVARDGDRRAASAAIRQVRRAAGDYAVAAAGPAPGQVRRRPGWLRAPVGGPILTTRPLRTLSFDPTDVGTWALAMGDLEVF